MRLFINASNQLVTGPNQQGAVGTSSRPLSVTAGRKVKLELQFLDTDPLTGLEIPVRREDATAIGWGLKPVGKYEDPTFTIHVVTFTRPVTEDGFYAAVMDTGTDEVKDLLKTPNGDLTDDLPLVQLAGEITIQGPDDDAPDGTDIVYLTVTNHYTQGTESEPNPADPAYPPAGDVATKEMLVAAVGLVKSGSLSLASGVSSATVAFGADFPDETWLPSLNIVNTAGGANSISISAISAKTAGGFTVSLEGETDSDSYVLLWSANSKATAGLVSIGGADKQAQFNDGGVSGVDARFTFDKTTGDLSSVNFRATGAVTADLEMDSPFFGVRPGGDASANNAITSDGAHLYWRDNTGTQHQLDN